MLILSRAVIMEKHRHAPTPLLMPESNGWLLE